MQQNGGLWPPIPDFNPMLQNPQIGFNDADLKPCTIERDANNQPRPRTGNFAVCYKAQLASTGNNICVRLFSRRTDERRERYLEISQHLKANPLDCLVRFEYVEKGIRHPDPAKYGNGAWYPIVRMDWIEGSILFDWLREQCGATNSAAIARAADQWVLLAEQLEAAGIAHGDLQHANVMVTSAGQLKLVDYDCMCVPKLVGRRNLELGVEPYQHPERNEDTALFPGLDRFSELFILVVLRTFAADPGLWFRHIEPPGGLPYDKLLFRKSDFDDPGQSRIYRELIQSSNPDLVRLTKKLFELVKEPMKSIPPLASFLFDGEKVHQHFRQHEWDEGIELIERQKGAKIPDDLQKPEREGRERIRARLELESALQSGDESQIQKAYKAKLLDDYPRAFASVQAAKLSLQVQDVLTRLQAAKSARNWRHLVDTWDANFPLVDDRKSCQQLRAEVDLWRVRNELCDEILRISKSPSIDVQALDSACSRLGAVGGHPEVDGQLADIRRLGQQQQAWDRFLVHAQASPSELNDQAVIAAWKEPLFLGWPVAEQRRPDFDAAKLRLANVKLLCNAIVAAKASRSVDNEKRIEQSGQIIPDDYEIAPEIQSRLTVAQASVQAVEQMRTTLAESSPSEKLLAQSLKILRKHNALDLVTSSHRSRMELAERRLPILKQLASIDYDQPVDAVDAAIKAAWNEKLLDDCPSAARFKKRTQDAQQRSELLNQLDVALNEQKNAAAIKLLGDPLLKDYPFKKALADRIEHAREKIKELKKLVSALESGRVSEFRAAFDQRLIKDNFQFFAPYESLIAEMLQRDLLLLGKSGLTKPLVGPSITSSDSEENRFQLKWTWPSRKLSDRCILGICREMPRGLVAPAQAAIHRISLEPTRWETGGGFHSLTARTDWIQRHADIVAVWAVIDLGFRTFYSEPLVLGRLRHQEVSGENT